jgi:hypothetical protein
MMGILAKSAFAVFFIVVSLFMFSAAMYFCHNLHGYLSSPWQSFMTMAKIVFSVAFLFLSFLCSVTSIVIPFSKSFWDL